MTKIIHDSVIGTLVKTDDFDRYEGLWDSVNILVHLIEGKIPKKFHDFLKIVPTKDADFRRASAESLLELYNDTWTEGEKITEVEFARRIKIDSITFDEKTEQVSIYYDDADLFAGHSIKVDVSLDGKILKADLP